MELEVLQLAVGELEENCYIVWQKGSFDALVVDPGADAERIENALHQRKLTPAAFLITHCHGDHIGALTPLKESYPGAPIYAPALETDRRTLARRVYLVRARRCALCGGSAPLVEECAARRGRAAR